MFAIIDTMTTEYCPSNYAHAAAAVPCTVALPTMNYAPFAPLSGSGSCICPDCRRSGFGATFPTVPRLDFS